MSEIHDYYSSANGFIETAGGNRFYAEAPEFFITDIGHALSQTPRFSGHGQIFYSVAQHSLMVSRIVRMNGGTKLEQKEGLLHDATEAYLSDVPAPLKQYLPDYKSLDGSWERAMRKQYHLPPYKTAIVQEADWIALFIEANTYMTTQGRDFVDPKGLREAALGSRYRGLRGYVREELWRNVSCEFVRKYRELTE